MNKNSNLYDIQIELTQDQRIYQESFQDYASIIIRQCASALSTSKVSMWLLSEDENTIKCVSAYSSDGSELESDIEIDSESCPNYFSTLFNSRFIDVNDTSSDPRVSELTNTYLKPRNIQSSLSVALRYQGNVKGVLCADMIGVKRYWTNEETSFITSLADLLAQRVIYTKLASSKEAYKALFDYSNDAICIFDGSGFTDVNIAACKMFQRERKDLIKKSPIDLSPEYQPDQQMSSVKAMTYINACMEGKPQNFEWQHIRANGEKFHTDVTLHSVKLSNKVTLFAMIRDITSRKIAQKKLTYRATHDSLTDLLNREQLHLYVNKLIADKQAPANRKIAVVLIDLNRFKDINDNLGHSIGDKVLKQVSLMLNPRVQKIGGCLFRIGGDEFVSVFDSHTCREYLSDLGEIHKQWFNTTLKVDDAHLEVTASTGISLYPCHAKNSDELLRCADVAMYHAKEITSQSSYYDAHIDIRNKQRLSMLAELRSAIQAEELLLYFQPRVNITTGAITSCEALLRWQHPKLGLVLPSEFLAIAEMSDIIHQLSAWVLKSAFAQIKKLKKLGYTVPIAINLSTKNLTNSFLITFIKELLNNNSIEPHLLQIEITESALIKDTEKVVNNLNKLNDLGVSIAIDDFGTKYSSLIYLKELPVNTLKIDLSFVGDMINSKADAIIVNSIISLGHDFSYKVIAEGIENQETLDKLKAMQCDEAQGFFIAKPMSGEELELWLEKNNSSPMKSIKDEFDT